MPNNRVRVLHAREAALTSAEAAGAPSRLSSTGPAACSEDTIGVL